MRIRLLSDIHLELNPKLVLNFKQHADVVILAGDIGNPFDDSYYQFLQKMSLTHSKVFIVSGNHEYYNGIDMNDVDEQIADICEELDIHFLHRNSYHYKGVTFLGCTLWSHPKDPLLCKYMNDFNKIKDLTFDSYIEKHLDHKMWLEKELQKEGKKCVITHHLPLIQLVDDKYKKHPLNLFFASNTNTLGANYWCYGHTHKASQCIIDGVQYHCNPKGYAHETSGWNLDYIFNIE